MRVHGVRERGAFEDDGADARGGERGEDARAFGVTRGGRQDSCTKTLRQVGGERGRPVVHLTVLADEMREEGVSRLPPLLPAASLRAINGAVDAIVAAGWPAVCVFLYDQPWLCARLPRLQQLLERAVGEPCLQVPNVWTHVVRPVRGAAGW